MNKIDLFLNHQNRLANLNTTHETSKLGALPPGVQQQKEIDAILSHSIWKTEDFENEKILRIRRTESGYLVTTSSYVMHFDVKYLPAMNMGPVPFRIDFDPSSIEKRLTPTSHGAYPDQLKNEIHEILANYLEKSPFFSSMAINEIQRTDNGLTVKAQNGITYKISITYKNNEMILNFGN